MPVLSGVMQPDSTAPVPHEGVCVCERERVYAQVKGRPPRMVGG